MDNAIYNTYNLENSDIQLFSSSALEADIAHNFAPVKEVKESMAIFSFPKGAESLINVGKDKKYTAAKETIPFFSLLSEIVIKDVSQKKKKLWGLFKNLKVSDEEIELAKKSLLPTEL